jgi:predicted amidohydrolase
MAEERDPARVASDVFEKGDASYDSALTLVSDTVHRAKALFSPRAVSCKSETGLDPLEPYRIAIVPYSLSVKTSDGKYFPGGGSPPDQGFLLKEHQFDHFTLCVNDQTQLYIVERWCDKIVADSKRAFQLGARFALFPELSFPNFWPGRPEPIEQVDRRRKLNGLRADLDRRLQRLAKDHEGIIIAGSYHDWETFENICQIYFPEAEHSRSHKKLTTARSVNEYVKTSHGIDYPVYNVSERRFCVLICTDAFDLNMFFRQILATGSGDLGTKPEIFFVPSYYVAREREHRLKSACGQLSLATGQIVVFVNQSMDTSGPAVFVAGIELALTQKGAVYLVEITPEIVTEYSTQTAGTRNALNSIFRATKRVY